MRYRLLATAAALSVGLTACSSSSETAAAPDGTASASATKLTVWVMRDSFSDPVLDRFKTGFEQSHSRRHPRHPDPGVGRHRPEGDQRSGQQGRPRRDRGRQHPGRRSTPPAAA